MKAWAKFFGWLAVSSAAGGMFGLAAMVLLRHEFGL